MTGRLRVRGFATLLVSLAAAHAAFAHDAVKAIVVLKGGDPRFGVPCTIAVSVLAPPGMPIVRQIQRVSVSGAMTGHAMPPLEVDLAREAFPGEYEGRIAFSMAGPWRVTVRIDVRREQMWGTLDVQVRPESGPFDGRPLRYVVEMQDPVRQTLFPPLRTAETAIGLTLFLELGAVVLGWRRVRLKPPRRSRREQTEHGGATETAARLYHGNPRARLRESAATESARWAPRQNQAR